MNFEACRAEMEIKRKISILVHSFKNENGLFNITMIRSSNFKLYISSIGKFLPRIFTFDHVHYARWLFIHHYDMGMLKETNPEICQEFDDNENFTMKRNQNRSSKIGLNVMNSWISMQKIYQKYLNFHYSLTSMVKRVSCFPKGFSKVWDKPLPF